MSENRESVQGRRITQLPLKPDAVTRAGDFGWDTDSGEPEVDGRRVLFLHLPGTGESRWCAVPVNRGSPGGPRCWGWDGNEDKPTLLPSIHLPGVWHGFLQAGYLKSC